MNLNSILSFLIPENKKFFELFERAGQNNIEIAESLKRLMRTDNPEERKVIVDRIKEQEHIGDNVVHEIMIELSSNFITPFDREDIHYLASSLDNVADFIYASSKRMSLYKIDEITPPMLQLSDLIHEGAVKINKALVGLRSLKNINQIREIIVDVNRIENEADEVYNNAIAVLFDEEKDAIRLIKHKEILSKLEKATDCCEDVADAIQSIVVKHS